MVQPLGLPVIATGHGTAARRRLAVLLGALRPVLPSRPLPVRVRGGTVYLSLKESPMMRRRLLRCYEPVTEALLLHLLAPGMRAAEVGANRGYFSVLIADRIGPAGRLDVVEPDPGNQDLLERAFRRSGFDNVRLHRLAASDEEAEVVFYRARISGGGSFRKGRSQGQTEIRVPARRLDSLLAGGSLDVVKVDVEGADAEVLAGMEGLLRGHRIAHLLLDIDRDLTPEGARGIQDLLARTGYSWVCIDDAGVAHDDWRSRHLLWARPA